jgi:squalene-hopene/tetraprenyl-beta-curcumene cyclase
MQNRDGGWGAFDRDNDREFLCYVPFADHNAMIDPSTPDIAARVLEALGGLGRRPGDPAVDRALAYLRRTQEADGSWFGRWGVNYIYGTWQVLAGLAAIGVPLDDPMIAASANWLVSHQQPSGAWGESADSYAEPHLRGQGPATASQTAWAVLGLVAAGWHDHPATARGVRYLLSQQLPDGTWNEPEFTGTGFPRVFYLRYHLYRIYFPLLALSRFAVAVGADPDALEPAVVSMVDRRT